MEGNNEKLKFWQKSWIMWVCLIFFTPIGLVLCYLNRERHSHWKIIMAIFSIFFIITLVNAGNHNEKKTKNVSQQQETQKQLDLTGLTPDEQIIAISNDVIGSYKYSDQPVMVANWSENQNLRFVSVNIYLDGLTESSMKNTFDSKALELFKNLYTRDLNVGKVTLFGFAKTIDTYGNENNTVVMRTSLNVGTANKINWENFRQRMLEKAADDYFIAPVMKKGL